MRSTSIGLVTSVALAAAMATGACNSGGGKASGTGGTPGSGGSTATGGTSGAAGAPSCPGGTPCGGSLAGTWTVSSSCLALSGTMDVSLASLGCSTIPVSGSLQVTGMWTANGDGTYTDDTVTTGSIAFPLAPSCLSVSSVNVACDKAAGAMQGLGWTSVTCANDAGGNCRCTATANQNGGIGVVSPWAMASGSYTTSGSGLNVDSSVDYSYCASGNTLTLIPTPAGVPVSGTIVLQKSGSGSGGSPGSGGNPGSGGSGTGGVTGTGGSPGTGGTTSSGGATGSGGKVGSGGATGSGGTGGTKATGGATGTGGSSSGGTAPCDIYAAANTPCVAAHSTVRALLGSYSGSLYQIKRASDSTTKDIGVVSPGGLADSASQDAFCSGTTCTITLVYDQSGHGNFVEAETPDSTVGGHAGQTASNATQESLTLSGHKVYSLYMKTSQAYWRDGSKSGMPLGSSPQGIYMVTSGKHYGSGCCFDYGNGETSRTYVAGPSMDAVNFSNCTIWGTGAGAGPWVMADLEGGLYSKGGSGQNTSDQSLTSTYVTAMEKNNGTGTFALKGGDATTGSVTTFYSGAVPPGYNPAKKQGSIVLGSGGDCCYSNNTASQGTFYEGAVVSGYPSDATDTAIQANIVSAGYGK
ncbi:MAG TPA: arabinofuranosidase catalytic domain-containing protein [Polyangia bacterium]|nr:arabinofuranosidase catalytic domain-containing protein [Polyangia bacterium]